MLDIVPRPSGQARTDAYLGAVAEHLALRNDIDVPDWTQAPERFLTSAWFPAGLESLKAC